MEQIAAALDKATMIPADRYPKGCDFDGVKRMTHRLVTWLLSAASLLIVAYFIKRMPGTIEARSKNKSRIASD